MSNHTHAAAIAAIRKQRHEALTRDREYFERTVSKLREFKIRLALGEVTCHTGGGYTPKLTELIAQETRQLKYARDCVRRSRRALWDLNKLQRGMRKRVSHDI